MIVTPPIRTMTAEEKETRPDTCFGCGRDAIIWVEAEDGRLLGYCGYLDSGTCLAVVEAEAKK